jgi:hypothetical protein
MEAVRNHSEKVQARRGIDDSDEKAAKEGTNATANSTNGTLGDLLSGGVAGNASEGVGHAMNNASEAMN